MRRTAGALAALLSAAALGGCGETGLGDEPSCTEWLESSSKEQRDYLASRDLGGFEQGLAQRLVDAKCREGTAGSPREALGGDVYGNEP